MQNDNSSPKNDNHCSIQSNIETLSRSLVLTEPDDPAGLAGIHTQFEELKLWAHETAQETVAEAMTATEDILEKIILNEIEDVATAMEIVGRVVSALQSIVNNGLLADEVEFPEELMQYASSNGKGKVGGKRAPRADSPPLGLSKLVDQAMFAEFLARQGNLLDEIETLVLAVEKSTGNDGAKNESLKRLLHNLKGESSILGLEDVERLCHAMEDALAKESPKALADPLLSAKDWLAKAFAAYGEGKNPAQSIEAILTKFEESTPSPVRAAGGSPATEQDCPASQLSDSTVEENAPSPLEGDVGLLGDFVIEAREHLENADVSLLTLETEPQHEEAINALFRGFHTIKGVSGFLGLDQIRSLAHESENVLDRVRKGELLLVGRTIDVIFDSVDALKRLVGNLHHSLTTGTPLAHDEMIPGLIERIKSSSVAGSEQEDLSEGLAGSVGKKLGEILVESGSVSRESLNQALTLQQASSNNLKLGEVLVREGQVAAKDVAHALRSQKSPDSQQAVQVKETVKVDADRLDQLVEMIGELVIAESMVSQSSEIRNSLSPQLSRHLSLLDKITRELQEMGTSLRMVPLRSTFQKMARLVRDLAKKSGKQVDFVMVGEDTELDKSVVDKIGDPLVHMIRNAVDHGLESSPDERTTAGKPATGRVELRAFHKGGNIYIEIRDDGRGLDRKAILAKAQERGLLREGETLSDREVFNLIFQPGFSTAKVITDVSGRGVGMDVVKRNIDLLRGQVDIQSEPGKGTIFSIRLPLTLAIIDGMVVRVGQERYILPMLSIIRSIRPEPRHLKTVLNRGELLSVQGQLLPLFRLDSLFNIGGAVQDPTESIVVVVEEEGRQVGLLTDELLGQQQIVIKNLGESMRGVPGIAGGAIMPDGKVGLIVDISGVLKLAHEDDTILAVTGSASNGVE